MRLTIKRTRVAVTLAVLAGLVLAQSAHAVSPTMTMDHAHVRDVGADYISTSGCVQTEVDVFARDVLSDTGGSRTEQGGQLEISHRTGPFGRMFLRQWDCNGNLVVDGFGPPCCGTPLTGLTIARDLTSASLHTTLPIHDTVSNTTKDYTIDLTWSAMPPLIRDHLGPSDTHCIAQQGSQVENALFNDVFRGYVASLSGSVSDGTNVYAPDSLLDAFVGEDVATFLHIGYTDQPCGS